MSGPPFTMSKYATEKDLYKAQAEYLSAEGSQLRERVRLLEKANDRLCEEKAQHTEARGMMAAEIRGLEAKLAEATAKISEESRDSARLDFLGSQFVAHDSPDRAVSDPSWERGDVAEIAFAKAIDAGKTPAEAVRIALDAGMAHTPEAPK